MTTPVKCPSCGMLFGIQQEATRGDKKTLSIKHRDLYRTVEGGKVTGPCRRCGYHVTWPEEE